MDSKEYADLKRREAYREYQSWLPHCDKCEHCLFVDDRYKERRVCKLEKKIIENRVRTCPHWCPRR